MSDQTIIRNGNLMSYGSIIFKIDGDVYTGFTKVNYADKRERALGYGGGKAQGPRGRTRGKYTPEPVTVTMFRDSASRVREALAVAAGTGSYGDYEFEIEVTYEEAGDAGVQTDTIERCVWVGNSTSNEEGPDPLMTEIEFSCMFIRYNGLTLFDETA